MTATGPPKRKGCRARARATAVRTKILRDDRRPAVAPDKIAGLEAFIAKRTSAGGAPPES